MGSTKVIIKTREFQDGKKNVSLVELSHPLMGDIIQFRLDIVDGYGYITIYNFKNQQFTSDDFELEP